MGLWSEIVEFITHDLYLDVESNKFAFMRNLSSLFEIPSSPDLPFLQVGVSFSSSISAKFAEENILEK